MHPTGFEPVLFHRKTDYESGAFDHSATDAKNGADGNRTHVHLNVRKIFFHRFSSRHEHFIKNVF
jgi:hypothetical protein